MVLRVFLGRTISAAGGPGWAAPPATKAVSGQQQRGNRGDCRAKVNCKQGERLCAVLVGFQGQTLSERSREGRALSGAAALSHASPSRTRLASPVAGRALCQAELAAPLCFQMGSVSALSAQPGVSRGWHRRPRTQFLVNVRVAFVRNAVQVACKRGGHLRAVLVVLQGRTPGAAGKGVRMSGAAALSANRRAPAGPDSYHLLLEGHTAMQSWPRRSACEWVL